MTAPEITPIQQIDFGKPVTPNHFAQALYENHNRDVFLGVMQYLREEMFSNLSAAIKAKQEGQDQKSTLALGAFDGLSQVIVKLNAIALTAPEIEE